VHAAVPAEGQTASTLAWEIGRQLGYGPCGPAALVERIAADPRPVLILLPDLHKAGRGPRDLPAARPEAIVAEVVRPLLALAGVRLVIECGASGPGPELAESGALVLDLGPAPFRALPAPRTPPRTAGAVTAGAVTDWRTAPAELRERALDAALTDGGRGEQPVLTARELLADPGFLVCGSPVAITAALADPRVAAPARLRAVWARAAPALTTHGLPDAERAALLHATSLGVDDRLAAYLRPLARTHCWSAEWSLPGRPTAVLGLLPKPGDDDAVLVAADPAGRPELRRTPDGSLIGRVAAGGPPHRWTGLAGIRPDCAVALDVHGSLRPIPLTGPSSTPAEADHLCLYHNAITLESPSDRITALASDGDRLVLGDAEGRIHLWNLSRLAAGPAIARTHTVGITAVGCVGLPDVGASVVVAAGYDGTVRLWDSASGEVMPFPVERRAALATAVAMTGTRTGPVLAVAWSDQRLHLWRLHEGRMTGFPCPETATALALTPDGLLVVGSAVATTALRLDLETLWEERIG